MTAGGNSFKNATAHGKFLLHTRCFLLHILCRKTHYFRPWMMFIAAVSTETVLHRLQPKPTAPLRPGQIFLVVHRLPKTDPQTPTHAASKASFCRSGRRERSNVAVRTDDYRLRRREFPSGRRISCGFVVGQGRPGTGELLYRGGVAMFLLHNEFVVVVGRRCRGGSRCRWCR